jgi:arabinofuranan 3-O-arabinosyltransferase
VTSDLGPPGQASAVPVPEGATRWLRVTVLATADGDQLAAGISELAVGGLSVRREIALPADLRRSAESPTVLVDVARGQRDACAFAGDRPLCSPRLARAGEEDVLRRVVVMPRAQGMTMSGTVRPRPGPGLDRLLVPLGEAIRAHASSVQVAHPAGRAQAAVDRDLGTGWVAASEDERPRLTLAWTEPREVDVVQILVDPALASSRPRQVLVEAGGREQRVTVDAEGYLRFSTVRTNRLVLEFGAVDRRDEIGAFGQRVALPVGVSELRVPALDELRRGPDPSASVTVPCGFAPPVVVDGRPTPTSASGTVRDLLQLRPLQLRACGQGTIDLTAGTHRIEVRPTAELSPASVTLDPGLVSAPVHAQPIVRRWDAESRALDVPPSSSTRVLVVHENANRGWTARLGDGRLEPARIDGWQQGWLVPAGASGRLTLTFGPTTPYRYGLVVGGLLALCLGALAVREPRSPSRAGPVLGRRRGRLAVALGVGLLLAGQGLTALVGLVLAFALVMLARRGGRELPALVAGTCVLAAAGLVALEPWPAATSLHWPVQVLTMLGVCLAVLAGRLSEPAASGPERAAPAGSSLPSRQRR